MTELDTPNLTPAPVLHVETADGAIKPQESALHFALRLNGSIYTCVYLAGCANSNKERPVIVGDMAGIHITRSCDNTANEQRKHGIHGPLAEPSQHGRTEPVHTLHGIPIQTAASGHWSIFESCQRWSLSVRPCWRETIALQLLSLQSSTDGKCIQFQGDSFLFTDTV